MSEQAPRFHTVVIGAGPGGLTVAVGLAKFGRRVALVERRHVGGDCTNFGCIPSKALIHLARRGGYREPAEALAQVRAKRDALRRDETAWIRGIPNLALVEGEATVAGPRLVRVAGPGGAKLELRTRNVVVATGSRPIVLSIPGLPPEAVLTNESLFELTDLPRHLAIVGAGATGCEMAFAFRRLGTRVSLVDLADRVLPMMAPEASELIRSRLEEEGIDVHLGARATRYDTESRTLCLRRGDGRIAVDGVDRLLWAAGRAANVEGLNLEGLGIEATDRGIAAPGGRTGVPGVYALGDVTTTAGSSHAANAQGRRLVRRLALPWLPVLARTPSWPEAVYTEPEVAQTGPPLAALQQRYHPKLLTTLRVELPDTDRGYAEGLRHGLLLIHAIRLSGRVLSATIVGPGAAEMISTLSLAIERRLSLYALSGLVFPYPTLSEAIRRAADAFVFTTIPGLPGELWAYLRYRLSRP